MRSILAAALAAGCATRAPERAPDEIKTVVLSSCPDTILVVDGIEPWSDYDQSMVKLMNEGCSRRYSPAHCAVKITKTSVQEYAILCGFRERSDDDKTVDGGVHP